MQPANTPPDSFRLTCSCTDSCMSISVSDVARIPELKERHSQSFAC